MKVLIVTNYLPPKIGGIERMSHELAIALAEIKETDISVATAKWPTRFIQTEWEVIEYPYSVIDLPATTIFRRLPLPRIFRRSFWVKFRDLDQEFDLVVYQSHLFMLNWLIAAKLRRVKRRVWLNHGCNYVPLNSKIGVSISYVYERIGMFIMKRYCNEFIGGSKNAADWVTSKVGIPFQVLPNAVNLKSIGSKEKIVERQVRKNVLFVGRLVEGKGLLDCVSAVSRANEILIRKGDSRLFTLTIVGDGPLIDHVSQLNLNVEIDFQGELSHSKVIESMYAADFLIQAYSQPEGMTTVTLEGLSTGLLIVTTPLSGEENLKRCANYISGSINELPGLLLEARDLPMSRSELLASGRGLIEQGLTWDKIAQKLLDKNYTSFLG
jgi:glycosyltransferase involved in cell wall biosynthesis